MRRLKLSWQALMQQRISCGMSGAIWRCLRASYSCMPAPDLAVLVPHTLIWSSKGSKYHMGHPMLLSDEKVCQSSCYCIYLFNQGSIVT